MIKLKIKLCILFVRNYCNVEGVVLIIRENKMLETIQTKINNLQNGKKLILGSGVKLDEMQKLLALCESLESEGSIKIVNKHFNPKVTTQPATILIEKV